MHIIQFESISIRNFLSVGDQPIEISFKDGVNIITGINHDKEDSKNGAGKSTVIDALHFALFGSTIRRIHKDNIVNSVNKKNCEVRLTMVVTDSGLRHEYHIHRKIAPSECYVYKNGEDVTRSTLPKTNDYIRKLIKSTSSVFQNSVIMTVNNTEPFMALGKTDKRKFIENVLNLEVFSVMLAKSREEYNDLRRFYEVEYAKHEATQKTFNSFKQQLDYFESNKQKRIGDIQQRIDSFDKQIQEMNGNLKKVPDNVEQLFTNKIDDINKQIDELDLVSTKHANEVTSYNAEIRIFRNQIKELEKKGAICINCQRPYPEEDTKHQEAHRQELLKKIEDIELLKNKEGVIIEETELKIKELRSQRKDWATRKDQVRSLIISNNEIQSKISYIMENMKNLGVDLLESKKETNIVLEQSVKDANTELSGIKREIDRLNRELDILECVKFVVSEEGVKTYIVKKILKVLNQRLAFYLKQLEANCFCSFNEYFDEIIIDERGESKSYFNFSGGERKRIDLACLFAFLDIRRMQGDICFGTTFYDELLDSALDNRGIELVVNILRDRVKDYKENCYIITHRGNAITSRVDNIICMEKRNGFTQLQQLPLE